MKNLGIVILTGFISLHINAQKIIEKNIVHNNRRIEMDVKFASEIEVKTWNMPTVYLKADISTKDRKYLDVYELDIYEDDHEVRIISDAEPMFKAIWDEYSKDNPQKERHYFCSDDAYTFNYTLYVPKNTKFKISSINGSLYSEVIDGDFTADLINGDIDIEKYSGTLDLSTINGAIDLKMINADLVAETIHGDIYADKKLRFDSENRHVGQKISGRIAEGKNRLSLNTINGNMYLRL